MWSELRHFHGSGRLLLAREVTIAHRTLTGRDNVTVAVILFFRLWIAWISPSIISRCSWAMAFIRAETAAKTNRIWMNAPDCIDTVNELCYPPVRHQGKVRW